jgi:hypothetical protein
VKGLSTLIAALLLLAAVVAGGGLALLLREPSWDLELAKWLLTLSVGLVTAGAIAGVYKMMDYRERRSAGWRDKLSTVTQAHDAVQKARMRMVAHRSAKSYSVEMESLVSARELLRRTFHEGEVDQEMRGAAKKMWKYLESLGLEYQAEYFEVSRYQLADQALVEAKVKRYVAGDSQALDENYFAAPRAYRRIEQFEKYAAFIDPQEFAQSDFTHGYEELRKLLQKRLGVSSQRASPGAT